MYCVVLVTAKDESEADRISRKLLELKLVACSNIVKDVQSLFSWKGQIDQAKEVLMVFKTKENHLESLFKEVRAIHSYDTPEIIALPIIKGDADYLSWVDEETKMIGRSEPIKKENKK